MIMNNGRESLDRKARADFVGRLEQMSDSEVSTLLKLESSNELYVLNGLASPRLKELIQQELRNTEA